MLKCPHCNKELQVRIEVLSGSGYHDVDQFYKEETPAPSPAHEKVIDNGVGDQHATFSEGWRTAKVEPTRAVFEFEPNDVVTTTESGSTYLYRGDVCYLFAREDEKQPMVSWCHAGMRNTDERNMHRSEIIELLNKRGITAKFPDDTSASDSVKGEMDIFGRPIIERLGGAFIVKCENGRYSVSRGDGRWWDCVEAGSWCEDRDLQRGCFSVLDVARSHMKLAAASLELPTANPAASAKGKPSNENDMCDYIDGVCCNCGDSEFGIGPNTCANLDRLRGNVACGAVSGPLASIIEHIASLKREVAELRKARQ